MSIKMFVDKKRTFTTCKLNPCQNFEIITDLGLTEDLKKLLLLQSTCGQILAQLTYARKYQLIQTVDIFTFLQRAQGPH